MGHSHNQLRRPITNGLIARSARLLSIANRPSHKKLVSGVHWFRQYSTALPNGLFGRAVVGFSRHGFQGVHIVPSCVSPTAHHGHGGDLLVATVPVAWDVAGKPFEKGRSMRAFPGFLVVEQDDGGRVAPGTIQPHVRVLTRLAAGFSEYLHRGFVRVHDVPLQE